MKKKMIALKLKKVSIADLSNISVKGGTIQSACGDNNPNCPQEPNPTDLTCNPELKICDSIVNTCSTSKADSISGSDSIIDC